MSIMKGQNLRLFIGSTSTPVALCKSAKISYSMEYEDSTTKDTPTGKTEEEFTKTNISISFDCLVGDIENLNKLKAFAIAGTPVAYEVAETEGTNNQTKTTAGTVQSGKAVFDSFDIDATDRSNITASGTMHDVYVAE